MYKGRYCLIIIMFFLFVLSFSLYSYNGNQADDILLKAEKFYKDGNFKESLRLLKEFQAENESNQEIMKEEFSIVYYLFSKIYFDLEDHNKMENNLRALFELNPDYEFPEDEDADFVQRALEIKNEIEKQEGLLTVVLKNGDRKRGRFLSQNDEMVTIETGLGTESIKKRYILETRPPLSTFRAKKKVKIRKEVPKRVKRKKIEKSDTSKFSLFFDGGYTAAMAISETNYELNWNYGDYNDSDTGSIISDVSSGFGFSAGFNYFFTSKLGVSLSVHYNLKQDVDLSSNYNYTIYWWDNTTNSHDGGPWENTGEVTVMPINFNIIYNTSLSDDFFVNIYGGLSVFLTKVNMSSHIGLGAVMEDEYYYFWDWFKLEVRIEESDTVIGGNVGIHIGTKLNNMLGVYLGAQYFYAPPKEYTWQLIKKDRYEGELGQLFITDSGLEQSDIAEAISEINFSFFKVFIGINIYL